MIIFKGVILKCWNGKSE